MLEVIIFCSYELQRFDIFSYELLTMIFDYIKLSFYNIFLISVSQRNGQRREIFFFFFFSFFPHTLGEYKCHFNDLK
jgi:hypothetical protein